MISTVTTTVSTIVTTTTLAGSFALITILTLLVLLIQKEIVHVADSSRWQRFGRALMVVIVPLALVFLALTAVEVLKVLR